MLPKESRTTGEFNTWTALPILCAVVFGGISLYLIIAMFRACDAATRFVEVEARIVEAHQEVSYDSDNGTSYSWHATAEYEYNEVPQRAVMVIDSWGNEDGPDKDRVSRFQSGLTTTIIVDPDDPSEVRPDRNLELLTFVSPPILTVATFASLGMGIWLWGNSASAPSVVRRDDTTWSWRPVRTDSLWHTLWNFGPFLFIVMTLMCLICPIAALRLTSNDAAGACIVAAFAALMALCARWLVLRGAAALRSLRIISAQSTCDLGEAFSFHVEGAEALRSRGIDLDIALVRRDTIREYRSRSSDTGEQTRTTDWPEISRDSRRIRAEEITTEGVTPEIQFTLPQVEIAPDPDRQRDRLVDAVEFFIELRGTGAVVKRAPLWLWIAP